MPERKSGRAGVIERTQGGEWEPPLRQTAGVHAAAVLALAVLSGLAAAAGLTEIFRAQIGHDQAWQIYCVEQMRQGVPLNGNQLIEVNPPFILWFMSLPVLLASALHMAPADGFRWFFDGLVVLSLLWSVSLFRRVVRPGRVLLWSFVLVAVVADTVLVRGDEIGQREHLAALLLLPYLLLAAARMQKIAVTRTEAAAIGLAAAVAICLKPQQILEVALVEALVLLQLRGIRRWLDASLLAFAAALVLYVVSVRILAGSYLSQIVPLLRETYWGFNVSMRDVLLTARRASVGLLGCAAVWVVFRRLLRARAVEGVLIVASLGAVLAFLQQHKGWTYQLICVKVLTLVLAGLLLGDLAESLFAQSGRTANGTARSGRQAALTAAAVFAVAVTLLATHMRMKPYPEEWKTWLAEVYRPYPPGTAVGLLSIDPFEFPAILDQNKLWASRFMHLWLLPSIIRSQDPAERGLKQRLSPEQIARLSEYQRRATAEDLARWRPAVIAVDSCGMIDLCPALQREGYGDLPGWFSRSAAFREQWAAYRLTGHVGVFDVFTRADAQTTSESRGTKAR